MRDSEKELLYILSGLVQSMKDERDNKPMAKRLFLIESMFRKAESTVKKYEEKQIKSLSWIDRLSEKKRDE